MFTLTEKRELVHAEVLEYTDGEWARDLGYCLSLTPISLPKYKGF